MSTKRIPDRAGFVGTVTKCRWCEKPKPWPDKYRRTFCSDDCVEQHKIRTQPDHAAKRVLERDRGICCACGLDTVELFKQLDRQLSSAIARHVRPPVTCSEPFKKQYYCDHESCREHAVRQERYSSFHRSPWIEALKDPDYLAWCAQHSIPTHMQRGERRLWEMDHIRPVVEGGADCGLDNLRTLCWRCHRAETAALAARRAAKRKTGA